MTRVAPPLRGLVLTRPAVRGRSAQIPVALAGHAAVLAGALGLWVLALLHTDLTRIAGLGLLQALPPEYFAAVALLLTGFVHAVSRPTLDGRVLTLYVGAFILVLHATTAILYDEPRYAWTYKHLGVINAIAAHGSVDRTLDIYANWSGFFALNAWLSSVTGMEPITWAAWSQVLFNVLWALAGRFALRGVTSDGRILWVATWLFLLANWIGQDYLAPQAFAMTVALVLLGIAVRVARVRADAPVAPGTPALIIGGVCWIAIVISHQLTPVLVILAVGALALTTRRIPLWVPIAMGLTELAWIAMAWPYLSQHITLLDNSPKTARPAGLDQDRFLPGTVYVGWAARASVAFMVALAGAGFLHRLRAGRPEWALAALIAGPVLALGAQSYGGEGLFRVYLLALPWLALLAAAALVPRPAAARRRHRIPWRLTIASAALGMALLPAYFGLELVNRVTTDDVRAATWWEQHAPKGSILTYVAPNFPNRLTARYGDMVVPSGSYSPNLTDEPAFRAHRLGPADVVNLAAFMAKLPSRNPYIVLSPSEANAARLIGALPDGSLEALDRALGADPAFALVYRHGRASIYTLRRGTLR
jgi:hypothetical protein